MMATTTLITRKTSDDAQQDKRDDEDSDGDGKCNEERKAKVSNGFRKFECIEMVVVVTPRHSYD